MLNLKPIGLILKTIVLLIVSLYFVNAKSQNIDYEKIMKYVNQTPANNENSTILLSNYLCSPYQTEIEKFASIYYWVAKNISYDDEMAKNPRLYFDFKEVIVEVMKSKRGVCQHYAELFAELSRLAGLKAYTIDGYTMDKGKVADVSHAWNLVNLDGKWLLIDATWANAVIKKISKKDFPREYFMIKPEEMIKTHIPFDPIWQVLSSPVKYDEFDSGKFNLTAGNFNYNDSIQKYFSLNTVEQQEATISRMQTSGKFNNLIKKEFSLKQKNLATYISNNEILKYNNGIIFYNKGMEFLNKYIKLRNNKFKDKKYGKNALLTLLDSSSVNILKAESIFENIQILDSKIRSQIKTNTANINKSKIMMKKEQEYINQYFK